MNPKLDFLIIGAQKSGTSFVYENLCSHPKIVRSKEKEIQYFSLNYDKGLEWYADKINFFSNSSKLHGEASPYYLFHPLVPKKVKKIFPNVKIIVILRDPVERAFSQYFHEKKLGYEKLPFLLSLVREIFLFPFIFLNVLRAKNSLLYRHNFYISRGFYGFQLRRWKKFFDDDCFLILNFFDLKKNPQEVMDKVFDFLEIDSIKIPFENKINEGNYSLKKGFSYFLLRFIYLFSFGERLF